jgi:hypothetical protein
VEVELVAVEVAEVRAVVVVAAVTRRALVRPSEGNRLLVKRVHALRRVDLEATIEPLPTVAGFLLNGDASAKPGLPSPCFHAMNVS